jgi:hypothetical protein
MKKIFLFITAVLFFYKMAFATKISTDQNVAPYNNLSSLTVDFNLINTCLGDSTLFINTSIVIGDSFLVFLWKFGDSSVTIIRTNPKHVYHKSGNYTVWLIAITHGGLKDSVFKTISIYPKPAAPIITRNGNTLNSSAASDNQWFDSTGAITGATGQSFMPSGKGNYWVKISVYNGCSSDASNMISYNPTLIYEQDNSNNISVYPNPNNGLFYIRNNSTEKRISTKIYDALGKLVYDDQIAKGINRIDLINEPNGMYYLLIQDEKGILMKKSDLVILIR